MASYNYKCPKCEEIHEISHSINESPEIKCPKCDTVMRKSFSAPAVTFKGSGWGSDR